MSGRGFADWSCPKCRRSFGTCGEFSARVTCPHCKHEIDASADLRAIDEFREQMHREAVAEWEARTPAQVAAFEQGQRAFTEGAGPMDAMEHSPHVDRRSRPVVIGDLHRWFMWGWHTRESGKPVGASPIDDSVPAPESTTEADRG